MNGPVKAVIFDMDGVLVDSEPLWRRAMIKGFSAAGMAFTEDDCRKTTGRRFNEVVEFWLKHHGFGQTNAALLERDIINELLSLIEREAGAIEGVMDILHYCDAKQVTKGLATSSSNGLVRAVLKKLDLNNAFNAVTSAEFLKYGKPHPEVFLNCADELKVLPTNCLVIEDSLNGVIAAKAAQMQVIAVPDAEHAAHPGFSIASHTCANMREALQIISGLI